MVREEARSVRRDGMSVRGRSFVAFALAAALLAALPAVVSAHGVSGKDAVFLQGLDGRAVIPLMFSAPSTW
jgi:hypothetical protein